jgi:hypothetical protein
VPAAICQLVAGPLAGALGARIGFRSTLAAGAGLATLAFVSLALEHSHPWQFTVAAALLGTGVSFAFASMANLIVGAVPQSQVGWPPGSTRSCAPWAAPSGPPSPRRSSPAHDRRNLAAIGARVHHRLRDVRGRWHLRDGGRAARAPAGRIAGARRGLAAPAAQRRPGTAGVYRSGEGVASGECPV